MTKQPNTTVVETMPKNKYVFISYASKDAEIVGSIASALQAAGIKIWMDVQDIAPGANFAEAIRNAIDRASAYIYVASHNSAVSNYMQLELIRAITKRADFPLIPVILDDAGIEGLPHWLKVYQGVDLRRDFDSGLRALTTSLAKDIPTVGPMPPSAPKNKGYAFISYSIHDNEFLEDLKAFLGKHGYGYWDFHESKRDYQTQFHLELEGVIRDSQAVLCVVTPQWKLSRWAPREYLFSEEIAKPIFLLKYRALEPTLLIAGSSYIDFVNDKTKGYSELDRELRERGF
jgi:TIR domain